MKYLLLFLSTFSFAQQSPSVDFKTIHAAIEINPIKRNIIGKANYTFELNKATDTIRIDAQKMVFTNVMINNKTVAFKDNKKQLLLFEGYHLGLNTLTFEYEAFPIQTMYFVNWDFSKTTNTPEQVQGQIWTQGQGKYTSHWLPSFDDVNEKVIFSLDVRFQKSFAVISNGNLTAKIPDGESITWKYEMNKPMSSYLLMLVIGHFENQKHVAASGIPLEFYYEKEDADKVEPTYRYSRKIIDFLEKEIGVPYPWEIYRQIPVRDFLYAGMENTSSTVFSRDFVVDSIGYNDRDYLNINAHELAHQWFGDLVTAKSAKDHWLQEGFATYYALLAEREVFGEDYFYNKLFATYQQLKVAAKTDTIPILNEKASSLSFYQKGAWALHVLRESIGREKFNLAVRNYIEKHAYANVTTDDFMLEINKVSDFDTQKFTKTWLETAAFPDEEALNWLLKNDFVKQYIELRAHPIPISNRKANIAVLESKAYYPIKELLLYQIANQDFVAKGAILSAAFETKDWKVRKVLAQTLTTIPESFRLEYETLLEDPSYETREIALFNLWKQFPDQQKRYVEITKNWVGFQDKNLKLLHLSLGFLTAKEQQEKSKYYRGLLTYTGTNYDSNLQQAALEKLLSLEMVTDDVLRSLVYGTTNHRWQFVKFSKDTIRQLLKTEKNRLTFTKMIPGLPFREKTQLERLLAEKTIQ